MYEWKAKAVVRLCECQNVNPYILHMLEDTLFSLGTAHIETQHGKTWKSILITYANDEGLDQPGQSP